MQVFLLISINGATQLFLVIHDFCQKICFERKLTAHFSTFFQFETFGSQTDFVTIVVVVVVAFNSDKTMQRQRRDTPCFIIHQRKFDFVQLLDHSAVLNFLESKTFD